MSSYKGTSLGDNPGYIYKYMKEKFAEEWEFIWEYDGSILNTEVKTVKSDMLLKKCKYLLTSGVIISNCGLGSYVPKRKEQLFINTWHGGGAYKRVGIADLSSQNKVENYITKICGKQTDIFISSSRKFTEVMSASKLIPKERFLECGMPRNDSLVKGIKFCDAEADIRKRYHIMKGEKMVLYAPTFRGKEQSAECNWDIDIEACVNAFEKRFGGSWCFLVRKHHFVKAGKMKDCIDVSDYPDMQSLLQVVDVLITDYSSSMWDFSLTRKPGFLYTPDIDTYSKERSFYTDPKIWSYPVAESNDKLVEMIEAFDYEENESRIKKNWKVFGNCETGNATEIIVGKIREWIEEGV